MNPPLLLLLCFPLFLIILSSPSPNLKVDALQAPTIPPIIARPGCPDSCGYVSIPFPFGVGAGCYLDPWFEIQCNTSNSNNNKPFLSKLPDFQVMEITVPDYSNRWLSSVTVGMPSLNVCGGANHTKRFGFDLRGTPFNFSTDHNLFLMEGCQGSTLLLDQSTDKVMAGCSTICHKKKHSSAISTNKCNRDVDECCQMPLTSQPTLPDTYLVDYNNYPSSTLQFYEIGFYGQSSGDHPNCTAATLIRTDYVDQYIGKLSTWSQYPSMVPVLLLWSWVSNNWPDPYDDAYCWRDESTNTTQCRCNRESAGNPYVLNGCQPQVISIAFTVIAIAIGIVFGCPWLFRFIKRQRKTERRVKIFKLKLQQHQSSNEGVAERTKLFTHKKLNKATDHFNENRILGRGGQGIVYKGMLNDGTIVAIKKSSKLMDESQMEQFINEVVILSIINHRNVVKLLGCCLETEVPLLVYEFVSNGTLSQHIHHPSEDFVLTWAMRLKIAADSAGAIAYLHSSSSTPIYHRDIKPCNILLDEKYRAKVSDFGSSKSIEIDQTHLTTLVQGTLGYLDLEYFGSGIFTDKSDVYSFGVVLLELLTSKKPIYRNERMEQKVLITEFLLHVQNSKLLDILDDGVVKEAKKEELTAVADLAKRCLNESGRLRPNMKEVAMTLEMIIKSQAAMSTQDQQASPNEGFSEIFKPEMMDADFMSGPIPTRAGSPMYIDVHPLLHDTI
ncbi:hypothetical protein V2J09_023627 [Rumex salicifolius]